MSDISGGASAPADAPVAASNDVVTLPNPISTEGQPEPKVEAKPEPVKAEKAPTAREALARAAERVEKEGKEHPNDKAKPVESAKVDAAKAADPKVAPKTEAAKADAPVRDETGKFAPKEPAKADAPAEAAKTDAPKSQFQAPSRFSPDAKAAWETSPEPVRAEVARMEKEMSAGLEKYRSGHDEYEKVRQFDETARKNGSDLPTALFKVVAIEDAFQKNGIAGGLQKIADHFGFSLKDAAAQILNQTPEQQSSQSDATIRELRGQLEQLTRQVGGVTQTMQHQRETATLSEINKFAEANPRFEELAEDIAFFMKAGRAKDLSEAYQLAERLNPAPAGTSTSTAASSAAPVTDLKAQTLKGSKSINGAPSSGSDPVTSKPSSTSIKDALKRAMAQAG